MIYFLLGLIVGILLSVLNVLIYQKKVQEELKKIVRKNQMAESINLDDELQDISIWAHSLHLKVTLK